MKWKVHALKGALIAVLGTPSGLLAQTPDATLATEALAPSTRALLIQEMQALAAAMGRIHRAMVIGEYRAVATEAKAIHDSFVLAQELSESQRQEIQTTLPSAFVSADQNFHELSARLVDAATQEDARLERLWFDEMTRACLACHRTFAGKRFPGLLRGNAQKPDGGTR
jgi:cytochrome c556